MSAERRRLVGELTAARKPGRTGVILPELAVLHQVH
jgi:hypothetical protein